MPFIHNKECAICGEQFESKRLHAITCRNRCRFVMHKLKVELNSILSSFSDDLWQLTKEQFDAVDEYVKEIEIEGSKGGTIELVDGFENLQSGYFVLVFRNRFLKHLSIWISDDEDIKYCYYGS